MLLSREESEMIWTYVRRMYHSEPEERALIKNMTNQMRMVLCRYGRGVTEINIKLSNQEKLYLYLSFKYNILSRKETKDIRDNSNYYESYKKFCEKLLIEIYNDMDSTEDLYDEDDN